LTVAARTSFGWRSTPAGGPKSHQALVYNSPNAAVRLTSGIERLDKAELSKVIFVLRRQKYAIFIRDERYELQFEFAGL
jgi:hypothetical protein